MITYEQAGELLGLAAARDQRTVGDADILAWHDDLNAAQITYDDARAALARYYAIDMPALAAEDRRRITSPALIATARKVRDERLQNYVFEPHADETPTEAIARRRREIAAVADGRLPAPSNAPALKGGPHPEVAAALAGVGALPPTPAGASPARPRSPLSVPCPVCRARLGIQCKDPRGRNRPTPHGARRRAADGQPEQTADQEQRIRAMSARHLARTTDHIEESA